MRTKSGDEDYVFKMKSQETKKIAVFLLLLAILFTLCMLLGENESRWGWRGYAKKDISQSEVALCGIIISENNATHYRPIQVTASVFAKTETDQRDKLDKLVSEHSSEVKDNIRNVLASAQMHHLTDPHLDFISSQIKTDMEKIVGKGLIKKVLIPNWHVAL